MFETETGTEEGTGNNKHGSPGVSDNDMHHDSTGVPEAGASEDTIEEAGTDIHGSTGVPDDGMT
eukprot:6889140-Ditylum_brightwellii.AAC.1